MNDKLDDLDNVKYACLIVSGRLYPATAALPDILDAEARGGHTPLIIGRAPGGAVVIGEKDFKAVDPMAYRILKAHLDGQWLMILPKNDEGPSLTDREAQVLAAMPLEWGEHKGLAELLDITRRQLQRTLERLVTKGLIEVPAKGRYRRL